MEVRSVEAIVRALNTAEVEYLLVGGLAVNAHGYVLRLWSDMHRRTPVGVFVYEPFDFPEEYAAARWEEIAADLKAPVVRCETLIAMKRVAARPQDLADVAELEEIQKVKEGNQ